VRGQYFQPDFVIVKQTVFVVVDKNAGGDVHGVHQAKTFLHAAFCDQRLDRGGDIHESAAVGDFKP